MRLLALAGIFVWSAVAQTSSMQGVVTDSSGAVVAAAQVTVTNLDTNVAVRASTNEQGIYIVPLLNAGRYKIECSAPGFAAKLVNDLRLEVGQTARVAFELSPGSVVETVQVSASAVLLNTETTDVGQVIDSKRILEMPLNGRNYLQLAQFTVGVLPGGLGAGSRARDEGAFAAVGMQIAQNNVLLDGNDNSSRTSGGPLGFEAQAVKPSVDAVGEFKVVTNNMSAEHGYRSGAKVLVSTKAGTNEFHGSVYEFLRNDALDGTNFFANRNGSKKPTYRQNQYGATFGGPLIKNRTFFFGSFQGTHIRVGQSYTQTVPSRDIVERGDFSQQPIQRRNVYDPLTLTGTAANAVRLPFANNVVPRNRWDPLVGPIMALYPASNVAGRDNLPDNYFFSPSNADDARQYDVRIDHNLTANHRIMGRYSLRDQFRNEPGTLPYPATGGQGQTVDLLGHNVVGSIQSTLSPTLFNEARFGFSKFDTRFDIPFTENLNKQFGIKGAPGDNFGDGLDYGLARFTPSGFAEVGSRSFWPNINNLANFMFSDQALWQRGRHTLKFGVEYRFNNTYRDAARFRRGQFAFDGRYTSQFPNVGTSRGNTGNGLADMLLGWSSNSQYGLNLGENGNLPYLGYFIQDDWKISNRVTLNIGLRYELFMQSRFPDPDRQRVARYLLEGINVGTRAEERFVFPQSGNDCGCKLDKNDWAPRLGLAWNVTDKTVLRLGGGLFYGENNTIENSGRFTVGPPRALEINAQQNFERTTIFVQTGFPTLPTGVVPAGVGVSVSPDKLPTLYAGQWFADLQRTLPFDTLLTVGYNGTKGTNLFVSRNVNLPMTPSATAAANTRLIRPQFNAVNLGENMLHSSYHSMTVKAERRFSNGFTFLSSFTWSHNIDQGNEALLDGSPGIVTPYELSRERSNSTLDRRLAWISSGVWELPFGKGRAYLQSGFGAWVLGGWQLGGIFSKYTGLPVSHSINVNNQNLGGAVRGDWVRNPNLPSSERTIDRWFDTGFVVATAPGAISNAGRNLIVGPGRTNLDVTVARVFPMPWEGHALQFRFESFNFTNTPNFGPPAAGVGTPTAGRINNAEDPRRIQFALKYSF